MSWARRILEQRRRYAMTRPTPAQLAAILTLAAKQRGDVQRALFLADPHNNAEINGYVRFTNDNQRDLHTRYDRVVERYGPLPLRSLFDSWFGPDQIGAPQAEAVGADAGMLLEQTVIELTRQANAGELDLPDVPPPGQFPSADDTGYPERGPRR